jgi:hypothetical protein
VFRRSADEGSEQRGSSNSGAGKTDDSSQALDAGTESITST